MDYFALSTIARELNATITGRRIARITQSGPRTLNLALAARDNSRDDILVFDAGSSAPGVFLLSRDELDSDDVTLLAKSFHKKLAGARITEVRAPIPDRFLTLRCESPEWRYPRRLWFELWHPWENVVCVEENSGTIIECLTKFPPSRRPDFPRIPGRTCILPDADSGTRTPLAEIHPRHQLLDEPVTWREVLQSITPMTPELAKSIVHLRRAGKLEALESLLAMASGAPDAAKRSAAIYRRGDKPVLSVLPIPEAPCLASFDSVLEAARSWRRMTRDFAERYQKFRSARRRVLHRIQRLERTCDAMTRDMENLPDPEVIRRRADLLAANYHAITPGTRHVEVANIFSPAQERIRIPLEEGVPPDKQIAGLYKKAAKAERAGPVLRRRIEEIRREIDELRRLNDMLESAESPEAIAGVQRELERLGIIIQPGDHGGSRQTVTVSAHDVYRKFVSSDGMQILAGKGGESNSILTFRVAAPWDFWLHVKDIPGAHVIIRNPEKRAHPPDNTLREAAQLAAFYSKARGGKGIPVMFTHRRHVRKAKNAPPGRVIVRKHETILIDVPETPPLEEQK